MHRDIATVYKAFAQVYISSGKYKKGIDMLRQAFDIFKNLYTLANILRCDLS